MLRSAGAALAGAGSGGGGVLDVTPPALWLPAVGCGRIGDSDDTPWANAAPVIAAATIAPASHSLVMSSSPRRLAAKRPPLRSCHRSWRRQADRPEPRRPTAAATAPHNARSS